jgi:hypothetical protein
MSAGGLGSRTSALLTAWREQPNFRLISRRGVPPARQTSRPLQLGTGPLHYRLLSTNSPTLVCWLSCCVDPLNPSRVAPGAWDRVSDAGYGTTRCGSSGTSRNHPQMYPPGNQLGEGPPCLEVTEGAWAGQSRHERPG